MSGTYNADANAVTLADMLALDSKLKGEAWSRLLDEAATQHNAFSGFTSPLTSKTPRGVRSIFCMKRDLKAGGADNVNFSTIGTPGGPGVDGATELSGNTSTPKMKTWSVAVGYHRDAVEFTEDQFEFLAAGRSLQSTTLDLLGRKMGIHRQNRMMMRLIKRVDGNVIRPNNRASVDALLSTDVLGLDTCTTARARLGRIGGMPMQTRNGPQGSPIDGYLVFGGRTAFLPIRNDDGFQLALAQGHARGTQNANFTGELIDWQGMPFFEMRETDEAWDDYSGSPLAATGWNNVEFSTASTAANCKFVTNASNTKSLYFQFWAGYAYKFLDTDSPSADSNVYYAWACNPDGSRAFLRYTGSANTGNIITVDRILAGNDVGADGGGSGGTSTKGYKTVGSLTTGTTSTTSSNVITLGTGANLPSGYVYTDKIQAGAYLIQANARGVCYGRSYVFGAMAAAFAFGRIERAMIEQERDYGFVKGRGYKEIFGVDVVKNPLGKPVGYLLVEHAIEHEGYPCPSV